jgi:hypothetical protein
MKTVKIIGLGIGIWSISLLWPQVNEWLTVKTQAGLALGLSSLILLYEIVKIYRKTHSGRNRPTMPDSNNTLERISTGQLTPGFSKI